MKFDVIRNCKEKIVKKINSISRLLRILNSLLAEKE